MPLSLGRENVFGGGCCCLAAGILFSGPGTRKNDLSDMAEREGFEPPIPVKVCPLSRRIVSTTHAPLRKAAVGAGRWSPAVSNLAGSKAAALVPKELLQDLRALTG